MDMKKRKFIIILVCLYGVNLLLTLLLGVMLFREFSVYNQSPQDTETEEVPRDTTAAETLSREQAMALYMDREKTHKPTAQDFDQIKKGMTVQEVVEILGKPHDFHGAGNFAYVMVWESVGGEMLTVYIGSGGALLTSKLLWKGIIPSARRCVKVRHNKKGELMGLQN